MSGLYGRDSGLSGAGVSPVSGGNMTALAMLGWLAIVRTVFPGSSWWEVRDPRAVQDPTSLCMYIGARVEISNLLHLWRAKPVLPFLLTTVFSCRPSLCSLGYVLLFLGSR